MNITLPYSWIQAHLKTKVKPDKVFALVTATGPTIDRVKKVDNDYLLEIEVTINRPDLLSVLGLAREMYAALRQNNLPARLVNDWLTHPPAIKTPQSKIPLKFIVDSRLSPRFTAVLLTDVKIGPSPKLIAERLRKAGMRALNNVIDISNYLMLETGQPNHPFDFAKIAPPQLTIRGARKGEKVTTLDQKIRLLAAGDIVYEDGAGRIIDLAGIMGGRLSEIDEKTQTVLFTVVNDYYPQIRKTAMRLGIQTEASLRLSKVLNQEVVYPTMLRGLQLLLKHTGGKVASEIFDRYPRKQTTPLIKTSDDRIAQLAGLNIPPATTDSILHNLGFTLKRQNHRLQVSPPIWRFNDIAIPEDITEEITRIYQYDNLPDQPPVFPLPGKTRAQDQAFLTEDRIRHRLTDWGLTETLSFSMLSQRDLDWSGYSLTEAPKIANPLTEDWEYLQPSLIPNLLKTVANNPQREIKIFEIANVFNQKNQETRQLIVGLETADYYRLSGLITTLLKSLNLETIDYQQRAKKQFAPLISVLIAAQDQLLGWIGQINPDILESYGINKPLMVAELDLDLLSQTAPTTRTYSPPGKHPPLVEDLSLEVPPGVTYRQVVTLITQTQGVDRADLVDHFQNRFTFRVFYQEARQQVSGESAKRIRTRLLNSLAEKLAVHLRSL